LWTYLTTGDYDDEMHSENCMRRLNEKRIPNLTSFSVTVLHNRVQDSLAHTSNSGKKSM